MNPEVLKLADEFIQDSPNIVPKQIADNDYFYPKLEGGGKYFSVLSTWSHKQGIALLTGIIEGFKAQGIDLIAHLILASDTQMRAKAEVRRAASDDTYIAWYKRNEIEIWPYSSLRHRIALLQIIKKETDDDKITKLLSKYPKDKILLNFDHGQLIITTDLEIKPSMIIDLIDSITPPGWLWLQRNEHLKIKEYHGEINLVLTFGKDYKFLVKMAQEARYYLMETDYKKQRNPYKINPEGDDELAKKEQAYQLTGGELERKQYEMERLRRGLPMFQHDCDDCIFLGHHLEYRETKDKFFDLYICPSRSDYGNESLIARYSSEGPDYASFPAYILAEWVFDFYSPAHPELIEAWHRAMHANLLTFPESRGENLRICNYCWGVIRPEERGIHCPAEFRIEAARLFP